MGARGVEVSGWVRERWWWTWTYFGAFLAAFVVCGVFV